MWMGLTVWSLALMATSTSAVPWGDAVVRYDGATGTFRDLLVPAWWWGLRTPQSLDFGPDNQLYVSSRATNQILRYNATTGTFLDAFVTDDPMTPGSEAVRSNPRSAWRLALTATSM